MRPFFLSPPFKTGVVALVRSVTMQVKKAKLHWRGLFLEGVVR